MSHQVTPPSFWAASDQPASSRMTRPLLIEILNEALALMDDVEDDNDYEGSFTHYHQNDNDPAAPRQPRGFQG